MLKLTLPIYYVEEFKTKPSKTHLIGMNAYRNWHFHLSNKIKHHYHSLVKEQLNGTIISNQYKLFIEIYYKNPAADGANIASIAEKFTLDSLQEFGVTTQDNVKYHLGTTWSIVNQDKLNPRVEITLQEVL